VRVTHRSQNRSSQRTKAEQGSGQTTVGGSCNIGDGATTKSQWHTASTAREETADHELSGGLTDAGADQEGHEDEARGMVHRRTAINLAEGGQKERTECQAHKVDRNGDSADCLRGDAQVGDDVLESWSTDGGGHVPAMKNLVSTLHTFRAAE